MIWNITFLEEAKQNLMKLDGSVRTRVLKGLRKVSHSPLRLLKVAMANLWDIRTEPT